VKFFSYHPNFTCHEIGNALCIHNTTHVGKCPPSIKLFKDQYCCEFYNPAHSLIDVASRFQARINREGSHALFGIDKGTVTIDTFNCSTHHRNISAIHEKFCVTTINAPIGDHLHIRDYVRAGPFFNWSTVSFASSLSNQNAALNSGAAIVIAAPTGPEPNPYRITLSDAHGVIDAVTVHVVDHGQHVTAPCHAGAHGHPVDVVFKVKPGTQFHVGLAGAILGLKPDEVRECSAAKKATLKPDEACIEFISATTPKRQDASGNSPQQNANNFLDALNNGLFDSAGGVPNSGVVSDPTASVAPGHSNAPHSPSAPHSPTAPHAPTHPTPGHQSTSAPGAVHHGLSSGAIAAIIFVSVFLCIAIIVIIAVAVVVKRRDRQHLDHF